MVREWPGHGRSLLFVSAVLFAGFSTPQAALTAPIAWERGGPFQSCLETRLQGWVLAKAELVANDNPAASEVDDLDVALWTVEALESCEAQVGRGDQTAELRFGKHMARWREHINDVVEDIKRRGRPD